MYEIKKGILHKDGKPVFALGQSYYPSFHPAKYPVPPEGDRIGEMRKDLAMMAQMGFNHVRFAAIGENTVQEDGSVQVNTPFVDAMVREAEKNEISSSVRLQGYAMNLRGHENVLMVDSQGNEQNPNRWFDFIRTTLHHPGMMEDNQMATTALAKHFAELPGVVAYQIYNEPHFPGPGLFDYHPLAIEAYRKYLVETGRMSAQEAETYEPPRTRKEQNPEMWAKWRMFSRDSLSRFLNESARAAKEGANKATFTCCTECQVGPCVPFRGIDMFGAAQDMDVMGYTCYVPAQGVDYYEMCLAMDLSACVARQQGKEAWCIELDSRTYIPTNIFNQNTYACVGSGVKGIVYYQWRGDAPSPATPIPNGCGLLNYDGTKTANYDNAAKMVRLLNDLSDTLVSAKRLHQGIGLLISDYAAFYADALENDQHTLSNTVHNSCISNLHTIYTDLRKYGLNVTITDSVGLQNNMEDFRILFVPKREYLLPEEDAVVRAFVEQGGIAYEMTTRIRHIQGIGMTGYNLYGKPHAVYEQFPQLEDICHLHNLTPVARSSSPFVQMQILEGEACKILCLANISCPNRPESTVVKLNIPATEAVFYTSHNEPTGIPIVNGQIHLENIADGGFLIVR